MNGFDYSTTSAPTAANGYVYVTGGNTDPSNDDTFALSESTGAVTWFKAFPGAGNSSLAVNANGVFVDFACGVYGYNPTTGQQLWSALPRCGSGIGATTSFLAGNTLYTPSVPASGYSGEALDTTSGATTGT